MSQTGDDYYYFIGDEDPTYPEDSNYESYEYYFYGSDNSSYYDYSDDELIDEQNYAGPAVLVLICLVGLIGNALVIFVIVRQVPMRKVTYLYLCNIAVVNVLFLVGSVPLSIVNDILSDWPFGNVVCKLNGYLTSVSVFVSVMTLMITGIDRYLAVLHPVRSRGLRTERNAMLVIAFVWMASFLLMAPRLALFDTKRLLGYDYYTLCSRKEADLTARRVDSAIMLVTMYLFPLLILAFCHLKIGLLLWQRQRPGAESQEFSLTALRERRRIAKIVFAITVAFGVGWLPMHIMNVYEDFAGRGDRLLFEQRSILVFTSTFGANAINPILYCLLSKHFRNHFRRALTCGNRGNRRATVVRNVTPVVVFEPVRRNEEIVIIDLENDVDDKLEDANDDVTTVEGRADNSESAPMIESKHDSMCSNVYSPTKAMAEKSQYLKVTPSCGRDSGHESEEDKKPTTSSKCKPQLKKILVKPGSKESSTTRDKNTVYFEKSPLALSLDERNCSLSRIE